MNENSKIFWVEPVFFLFFGVFHLHRIWGLIDRAGYSDFWISAMNDRGWFYYGLMIILSVMCIAGIVIFIKNAGKNYWWRWFYIFGGSYVLFDLFAIAAGIKFWENLLHMMFDTSNPFWNVIWSGFVILGGIVFILGIWITRKLQKKI